MTKRLVIAALACLVAGLAAWFVLARRTAENSAPVPGSRAFPPAAPKVTQAFLALEAQQRELDGTLWTNEVAALRLEQVFVGLWDQLRNGTNAAATLGNFAFGELRFGEPGEWEPRGHGIQAARLQPATQSYTPGQWRERLAALEKAGYSLEHSEWRQPRFDPASNGPARSVFEVAFYGTNRLANIRFIARGSLNVEWGAAGDPLAPPVPQKIEAAGFEVLACPGPPAFLHVPPRDITPPGQFHDQPLLVYDLDGDGLSEIILPVRNQVFWNQGGFRFKVEPLFATPPSHVTAAVLADFTNDGRVDLLCSDRGSLWLYPGDAAGRFDESKRLAVTPAVVYENPFVLTAGDVNGDGYLDLWLGQYKPPAVGGQMPTPMFDANDAFPASLLLNDRRGGFRNATETAGLAPKRFRRTYSASLVDLNDDGDLDLVVMSDFAGVDMYLNYGHGHFMDVTREWLDEPHLFGMAHALADFNRDAKLDLFAVGMDSAAVARLDHLGLGPVERGDYQKFRSRMTYGNRLYFGRDGRFSQDATSGEVARSGWSWGVSAFDWDNDGLLDLAIANGHISRASAADYESQFWRHDIYVGDSYENPAVEMYFGAAIARYQGPGGSYGGHQLNRFFLHQPGGHYLEAGYLLGFSLENDSRSVVVDDLDADGKGDLLVTSLEVWPRMTQGLHLYHNEIPQAGNWIGFSLREGGDGFSPIGAKVSVQTAAGVQRRWIVTGDSFLCQHAPVAHFGLGTEESVNRAEIRWPNGRTQIIPHPAINRYHMVTRP